VIEVGDGKEQDRPEGVDSAELAAGAVGSRDYPLLMGASLLVAALVVAGGFLTDVAYGLLDPRVRIG